MDRRLARTISTRLARRLAVAAGAGLLTAAALTPAPARAEVDSAEATVTIDFFASGGATCSVIGGDEDTTGVDPGEDFDASADDTTTVTDSGDPADTTEVSGSGDIEGELLDDDLAFGGFTVTGSMEASVEPDQGDDTACTSEVRVQGVLEATFEVEEPGALVTLHATGGGGVSGVVNIIGTTGTGAVVAPPTGGTATTTVFLPPGEGYALAAGGTIDLGLEPGGEDSLSADGSFEVSASLVRAGGARGKATGSGAPYLTTPGSVDCDDAELTSTFTQKGASVKKAVFSVGGKQRATRQNPKKGTKVTVPVGVDGARLSVAMTLDSGKRVSLTRRYATCG